MNVPCVILIQLAGVEVYRWQVGISWWWWIVIFVCATRDKRDIRSTKRAWVEVFCEKRYYIISNRYGITLNEEHSRLLIHCDIQLTQNYFELSHMYIYIYIYIYIYMLCCFRNDNTNNKWTALSSKMILHEEDSVMAVQFYIMQHSAFGRQNDWIC